MRYRKNGGEGSPNQNINQKNTDVGGVPIELTREVYGKRSEQVELTVVETEDRIQKEGN